jgi:phosphohistidine phosphatase
VARALNGLPVQEEPALASGAAPEVVMQTLADSCENASGGIALVGHEPDLGYFISHALAASSRSFHQLRKGGACLLELPARPRAGTATLDWALDPAQARALAAGGRP